MIYLENKIGVPQDIMIVKKEVNTGKTNKAVTEQQAREIAKEEAQSAVDAQQFKTINGEDIRGTGNIEIKGGGTAGVNSINGQSGDLKLKTINNNDLLGEGNIEIQGGGGGDVTSVNGQKGDVVIDVPTKVSQLQNDSRYIANSNTVGGVSKMWSGSQADYDAIENKDSGTLYIIL